MFVIYHDERCEVVTFDTSFFTSARNISQKCPFLRGWFRTPSVGRNVFRCDSSVRNIRKRYVWKSLTDMCGLTKYGRSHVSCGYDEEVGDSCSHSFQGVNHLQYPNYRCREAATPSELPERHVEEPSAVAGLGWAHGQGLPLSGRPLDTLHWIWETRSSASLFRFWRNGMSVSYTSGSKRWIKLLMGVFVNNLIIWNIKCWSSSDSRFLIYIKFPRCCNVFGEQNFCSFVG